jgi:hypothetical protein
MWAVAPKGGKNNLYTYAVKARNVPPTVFYHIKGTKLNFFPILMGEQELRHSFGISNVYSISHICSYSKLQSVLNKPASFKN